VAEPTIDVDAGTGALLTTLEAMARRLNCVFVADPEKVRAFSEAEAKRRARTSPVGIAGSSPAMTIAGKR
jgi:hypothetical protein